MTKKVRPLRVKTLRYLILCLLVLGLVPLHLAADQGDSRCISCHETKKEGRIPLAPPGLGESVHGRLPCLQCHREAFAVPHKGRLAKVDCALCHKEEGRLFDRSAHGIASSRADKDAPSCTSCHGDHHILRASDQRSLVFRTNLISLCARCHADEKVQRTHNLPSPNLIKAYENSVHGRLAKEGRQVRAAVCVDCHGNHLILSPKDPESKTNKQNIPQVCGNCHLQIYNEYRLSIHGRALKEGKLESPTCTDCHGEHILALVTDPQAGTYVTNIPATCGRCHENQQIIRKYGLPSDRYSTYVGSFHGIAMKYGDLTVANCTSCHEVHRILPAAEAESSINPQNLGRTCGKCHPSMKEATAIGKVHVEAKRESSFGMYFIRRFYRWFIGVLMVLFVGYIVLDVYGRIRRRKNGQ